MTRNGLAPHKTLNHVIDEYADYLRTKFQAKDPKRRAVLEVRINAGIPELNLFSRCF